MEDVAPEPGVRILEVAAGRHPEVPDDVGERVAAQCLELLERPHVEPPLDPFGVGVLGGEEAPVGVAQVAQHVPDRLLDDPPVTLVPGDQPRVEIRADQQRLVVQHLLEVRHQPVGIDRVAVEPATDLVVDAAGGHRIERHRHHLQDLRRRIHDGLVEEEGEGHRLGELRGAAEATEATVELVAEVGDGLLEDGRRQRAAGAPAPDRGALLDGLAELLGLLVELAPAGVPGVVDGVEEAHEAGHALPVVGWEVRTTEERTAGGVEEHGHGPAAAPRHGLDGLHVDGVDVGPFLAVDLDVDEPVVHHRGDGLVLERLVRHHVAPVARRVADGEQDRLVLAPARANASSPHGYQSTGLSACCRR